MLLEKRLSEIVRIVEEKRSITVQELMKILQTSESTIRRDLTVLNNNGMLLKVHGGAMALGNDYYTKDDEVFLRKDKNREEKAMIAKYAASLIRADDFVYMDAGTTTELMIEFIQEKNAVFVTNAIVHAKKLVQTGCRVYMLGGELKASTEAVIGEEAFLTLENYNFTKGFWGTNGVSLEQGFSTPDIKEANIKMKSMSRCRDRYVLSDPTKFSQISSVTFAEFESAKIITTKIADKLYAGCKNILEVGKV